MISKVIKSIQHKTILKNPSLFKFGKRPLKKAIIPQEKQQLNLAARDYKSSVIQEQTFSQRNGWKNWPQFSALSLILASATAFSLNPFSEQFYYTLYAAEKCTSLFLIPNLIFPQNTYYKYLILGSLAMTAVIPFSVFPYTFATNIIQMLVILQNNSQKISQKVELSKQEAEIIRSRLFIKIGFYCIALIITFLKIWHQVNVQGIKYKINKANKKNTIALGQIEQLHQKQDQA